MLSLKNGGSANPLRDPFSLSINTSSLLEPYMNEGGDLWHMVFLLQIILHRSLRQKIFGIFLGYKIFRINLL